MVKKRKALANVYVWGVVGCALGVLGVNYIARGPGYALRLTEAGATFLIAFPDDSSEPIELTPGLPEPETALEEHPAVLKCGLPFGHESLEPDANRAELRSREVPQRLLWHRSPYQVLGPRLEYDFTVAPGAHPALISGTATLTIPSFAATSHQLAASCASDVHNLASGSDAISVDLTLTTARTAGTGRSVGGGGRLGAFLLQVISTEPRITG